MLCNNREALNKWNLSSDSRILEIPLRALKIYYYQI